MPETLSQKTDLLVRDIMRGPVRTLSPDNSLSEAKDLFEKYRFHHVVIKERGKIVGVISDRDILKAISPFVGNAMERSQDRSTLKKRIHQIMKRALVTIGPDATAAEAAKTMLQENVSCLPVIDDTGKFVGLLSVRDFLRWAAAITDSHQPSTA